MGMTSTTFPDHVMALTVLRAPSARDGLCLNLEIEAREPGEVWLLQLSRAQGQHPPLTLPRVNLQESP